MDKRISKSFRVIFSSLYPNFNEEETKNSEKYFNFILANFPDRSEIILLKVVFFIFSFGIRRVFIKDKNIPKVLQDPLTVRVLYTNILIIQSIKIQQ
jgi:hypothetical protein